MAGTLPGGEMGEWSNKQTDDRSAKYITQTDVKTKLIASLRQHYSCDVSRLKKFLHLKQQAKFTLFSSEYTLIWVGKTQITACGVIKTTPNIHPSHVGWDTRPPVWDPRPVDLENSY